MPSLNGSTGFDLSASLRIPDLAGRSIRRLRGSIPVVIVAYAANPIAIPLEGAAGKSARNDEVSVSVIEVARDENAGRDGRGRGHPQRARSPPIRPLDPAGACPIS